MEKKQKSYFFFLFPSASRLAVGSNELPCFPLLAIKRDSMGWWLLRLSAKILALLRLSVSLFQLRLTKKLKINFLRFKELNINKLVFLYL